MAEQLPMPATVMKAALHLAPAPLLQPGLRWIVPRLHGAHPVLFKRLCRLAPASVLFEPEDTPHRFLLTIAANDLRLTLAHGEPNAAVRIKGRLAMLLRLLEGRVDSDTLFFSRDVSISGDTAAAVAFRNTLDGESISLLGDTLAAAGPLQAPARRLVLRIDRHVQRAGAHLMRWRDAMHRAAHRGHDTEDEAQALAAEITDLRARLARLEARNKRTGERTA
ncbi:MAG: SCP2 sterol-binding domain-containing protein [Rhodospirillales bacterium]|nr:SCP2 sterol-binding domain-containing protein [Rhodospirillales bacterium]